MFTIPRTSTSLPAAVVDKEPTRAANAWDGGYYSVKLHGPYQALRVHVGGGVGAVTAANRHLASGAGLLGRWYAIGDFIQTYDEYVATRALPKTQTAQGELSFFSAAALATFGAGTILNVGIVGPLFDLPGGGEQAEFVEGPEVELLELTGFWAREYGHA